MQFENENTFLRESQRKNEDAFHSRYDRSLKELEEDLGMTMTNYIGGDWVESSGGIFEDRFPGDISVLNGKFQKSNREDIRSALRAAKKAFEGWRSVDYQSRCEIIERAAGIMSERKYELAALITLENGKNRSEAMGEIDEAIDLVRYYPFQVMENQGYTAEMPQAAPRERPKDLLRPYGVWGIIPPFNFPMSIMAGMSTGALITGNTVVAKPPSDAPWPALAFARILEEAGLPPGVFNVVTGPGEGAGSELVENPSTSGIAFTGSRAVGIGSLKTFLRDGPRPFIAEMGGKNACIVTKEAYLEEAAEATARAAFGYSGQKCSACSRILVEEKVADDFLRELRDWTLKIVVGDPRNRNTFMGPLITESALRRYERSVEAARASGRIVTGGRVLKSRELNGSYVEPVVATGLKADHPLMVDELFLPFVCVLEVPSLEAAVSIANSSEYGLTAGIMSRSETEVDYFMDSIEAGTVYANRRSGATTAAMVGSQPFGGWKMSGATGKAAGGRYYLPQFMREQSQTRVL